LTFALIYTGIPSKSDVDELRSRVDQLESTLYHIRQTLKTTFHWVRLRGSLTRISAGGDNIWGIHTSQQQVYRWMNNQWSRVVGPPHGSPTDISAASDGTVIILNSYHQIFRWKASEHYSQSWTQLPGALTSISVGSAKNIWGCNQQHEIFFWNSTQGWIRKEGGPCVQITAAADGTVFVLTLDDQILQLNSNSTWKNIPNPEFSNSPFISISVSDSKTVIATNREGELWIFNGVGWERVSGGPLVQVSVGSRGFGQVWGVNSASEVWRHERIHPDQ